MSSMQTLPKHSSKPFDLSLLARVGAGDVGMSYDFRFLAASGRDLFPTGMPQVQVSETPIQRLNMDPDLA